MVLDETQDDIKPFSATNQKEADQHCRAFAILPNVLLSYFYHDSVVFCRLSYEEPRWNQLLADKNVKLTEGWYIRC
jgi:hypothetical protein